MNGIQGVKYKTMGGDWTSGGEHTVGYRDVALYQNCTSEIHITLLNKIIPIQLIFFK